MGWRPEERARRIAHGLCMSCPLAEPQPARPGMKSCARCADGRSVRRAKLIARGLCGICGEQPCERVNGRLTSACATCAKDRREQRATRGYSRWPATELARRIAQHLCLDCPKDAVRKARRGHKVCKECSHIKSARVRAVRRKRLTAMLCQHCGEATPCASRVLCSACSTTQALKAKTRREERLRSGLCSVCGKAPRRRIAGGLATECRACTKRRIKKKRARANGDDMGQPND